MNRDYFITSPEPQASLFLLQSTVGVAVFPNGVLKVWHLEQEAWDKARPDQTFLPQLRQFVALCLPAAVRLHYSEPGQRRFSNRDHVSDSITDPGPRAAASPHSRSRYVEIHI